MPFPILLDESGAVGRAYGAKTTPHMFVIGKDGKVAYSGAIDNDPSPTEPGERNYVISALRARDGRPRGARTVDQALRLQRQVRRQVAALARLTAKEQGPGPKTGPFPSSPPHPRRVTARSDHRLGTLVPGQLGREASPRRGSRCTSASPRSPRPGGSRALELAVRLVQLEAGDRVVERAHFPVDVARGAARAPACGSPAARRGRSCRPPACGTAPAIQPVETHVVELRASLRLEWQKPQSRSAWQALQVVTWSSFRFTFVPSVVVAAARSCRRGGNPRTAGRTSRRGPRGGRSPPGPWARWSGTCRSASP